MTACWQCTKNRASGLLCERHIEELSSSRDITSEQVCSLLDDGTAPLAWLIDQWGRPHGLRPYTVVGRVLSPSGLAILHHSVSAAHAQLATLGDSWIVYDRGSLNGTWLEKRRLREHELSEGDAIRFGSVTLLFTTRAVPTVDAVAVAGQTVPPTWPMEFVVELGDRGRLLQVRAEESGGELSIATEALRLTELEFGFIRRLIEQSMLRGNAIPAFVASAVLLRTLAFRSGDADNDNLRQLARRVRRKLRESLEIDNLITSEKGLGYSLGWSLESDL